MGGESNRLRCGRRALAAIIVLACACSLFPRRADAILIRTEHPPDAFTVADSARGTALATCIHAGSFTDPALFRTDKLLGGSIPDTFTAYPVSRGVWSDDLSFIKDERFVLLLRDPPPPVGPEFRRTFPWRRVAKYEAWRSERLRPSPLLPDTTSESLYRAIWQMPRMTRSEQVGTLASWIRSGTAMDWAGEALEGHPDVWGQPIRDAFIERLHLGWDLNQEWAAGRLAMHPDSVTRAEFSRLAQADSSRHCIAVILGSRDSSPAVRRTLLQIASETLGRMPTPAPLDLMPKRLSSDPAHADQGLSTSIRTLRALTDALRPDSSEAERTALIEIARWARPWYALRYEALRQLARDTAQVVRDLIWETSRSGRSNWEDAPEPEDVTQYWTSTELMRALHDPAASMRLLAYREVANRRDAAAADTLLEWLRRRRLPDGNDIAGGEVAMMLAAVGSARRPAAFSELMGWGRGARDGMRFAIIDALDRYGDRRAAALLREYAALPCGDFDFDTKGDLARALSEVGDAADTTLFIRWVRECPDSREIALEAIGVLGGSRAMVRVIQQIEPGPMVAEQYRDYELIESRVRGRIAERGLHGKHR